MAKALRKEHGVDVTVIAEELSDHNVTATALCPGAVATGFVANSELEGVDLWKKAKSPRSVAECGYDAMEKGKLVAFNEGGLKFTLEWILPILPRTSVLKMSRKSMTKVA